MEEKYLFIFVFLMAPASSAQIVNGPTHGKVVVCYVTAWATYREGIAKYDLTDIDPTLCTHLVHAFAGMDSETNEVKSLDPWQDLEENYGKAGYKAMVAIKEKYPHLKVIIAIGGWLEGSEKFSNMAAVDDFRRKFVESVLDFLNQYGFDGIDLHWKYPTLRGGKSVDKDNFVTLLKMLKEAFEPRGYILTAAIGSDKYTMESSYDLARMGKYLDLLIAMCYDYHGAWKGVVGANAPLRGIDDKDDNSVEFTIKYILSHGVSPSKLVLGLPFYGQTYILDKPKPGDVRFGKTTTERAGFPSFYTKEAGFIAYYEICIEITNKSSTWTSHWHDRAAIPYLRNGNRVITYDNSRSISIKVQTAVDYDLAGVMVYSIATDDFEGVICPPDTDTYVDFVNRYNGIIADPVCTKKALKSLNLPNVRSENVKRRTGYFVYDNDLYLSVPKHEFSNYPLMRTINETFILAIEEKRILNEVKRVRRENALAYLNALESISHDN